MPWHMNFVSFILIDQFLLPFVMLFQQLFVFLISIGFDINHCHGKISFALLSPSNNYYLLLRMRTNSGGRGYMSFAWLLMKISAAGGNEDNNCYSN